MNLSECNNNISSLFTTFFVDLFYLEIKRAIASNSIVGASVRLTQFHLKSCTKHLWAKSAPEATKYHVPHAINRETILSNLVNNSATMRIGVIAADVSAYALPT